MISAGGGTLLIISRVKTVSGLSSSRGAYYDDNEAWTVCGSAGNILKTLI